MNTSVTASRFDAPPSRKTTSCLTLRDYSKVVLLPFGAWEHSMHRLGPSLQSISFTLQTSPAVVDMNSTGTASFPTLPDCWLGEIISFSQVLESGTRAT